jgi:hypothetical protein
LLHCDCSSFARVAMGIDTLVTCPYTLTESANWGRRHGCLITPRDATLYCFQHCVRKLLSLG